MTPTLLTLRTQLATEPAIAPEMRPAPIGGGACVVLYTSSDCWRGAGISYVGIARGLEAHGFRPHVVSTCDEVTFEFAAAGVPVTQLPVGRGESWRLRQLLGPMNARAVLVDRAHDLRVGTLACAGTGVPLLLRYNHFGSAPPSDALTRIAYRTTLRGLVFLSRSARERVLGDTPFMRTVPPTTIHEGVDATVFRPCHRSAVEFRRTFGVGARPFILAVGALSPEKRYDLLFDALRLLRQDAPPLLLFGDGPDEARLRARARALGLEVRFGGRVSQRELVGAYNACSGLVHAGSVETFGLAVLEAMACARPVIASAGGALPEVVGSDGSCGALVASNSAWDIAAAIRRLFADPAKGARAGVRARDRARQRFSLAAMERSYAWLVARHTGYSLHREVR